MQKCKLFLSLSGDKHLILFVFKIVFKFLDPRLLIITLDQFKI